MLLRKIFSNGEMIRGGSWLFFEKVLLVGKGLFISYLFANWLPKEIYGQYQYVVAFLGVISVLVFPGMGVAIVQALARNKDGVFARATRTMIRMATLVSAVLIISAVYYSLVANFEIAKTLVLLVVFFPGYIIMNFWRYYYTGKMQFSMLVKMSVLFEIISLLSTITAIYFFPHLFGLVIFGIILPIPFSLVLVWILYRKTLHLESEEDNIRFGKKLSYTVGFATLATFVDRLLLGYLLGFSELAVYSIAMIIPEQAKGAITSFMVPLLPQYANIKRKSELKDHFIFFSGLSVLCVLVLYFLLPILFKIAFPQYFDGIFYARFLSILILFIPLILLETFFRSQKKERAVFRANLIGSTTSIFLALILVPILGINGAILAKICGQLGYGTSYLFEFFYPKN